jgi:hypothetical protein
MMLKSTILRVKMGKNFGKNQSKAHIVSGKMGKKYNFFYSFITKHLGQSAGGKISEISYQK